MAGILFNNIVSFRFFANIEINGQSLSGISKRVNRFGLNGLISRADFTGFHRARAGQTG